MTIRAVSRDGLVSLLVRAALGIKEHSPTRNQLSPGKTHGTKKTQKAPQNIQKNSKMRAAAAAA